MKSRQIDGSKLAARRDDLCLSQAQVAARVSEVLGSRCDHTLISKYENGHRQPNAQTWAALGIALEVDKNELLADEQVAA
jgi:transcriptional regulator with XRE-family HTH domain